MKPPHPIPKEHVPLDPKSDTGLWRLLEEMRKRDWQGESLHTDEEAEWFKNRLCRGYYEQSDGWREAFGESDLEDMAQHAYKFLTMEREENVARYQTALNCAKLQATSLAMIDHAVGNYLRKAVVHETTRLIVRRNKEMRKTVSVDETISGEEGDETPMVILISEAEPSEESAEDIDRIAELCLADVESSDLHLRRNAVLRLPVMQEFWVWEGFSVTDANSRCVVVINAKEYYARRLLDKNATTQICAILNELFVKYCKKEDLSLTSAKRVLAQIRIKSAEKARNFWGEVPW